MTEVKQMYGVLVVKNDDPTGSTYLEANAMKVSALLEAAERRLDWRTKINDKGDLFEAKWPYRLFIESNYVSGLLND